MGRPPFPVTDIFASTAIDCFALSVKLLDELQARAAAITISFACTLPEPVVVTVTFPAASMLSRVDRLRTALVFVGLQIPPVQLMFLVVPDDIVTLASASGGKSATDTVAQMVPTQVMPRCGFRIQDMSA